MESLVLGLRVLVSLGAVLGLMWFLHRRVRRGTGAGKARLRPLSVLSRQGIGSKASVVLVETDGKRFLLGVTDHNINLLHTADAPEPVSVPTPEPATAGTRRFDRELQKELHRSRVLAPRDASGSLTGSVLDLRTWKQALAAVRGGPRT